MIGAETMRYGNLSGRWFERTRGRIMAGAGVTPLDPEERTRSETQ